MTLACWIYCTIVGNITIKPNSPIAKLISINIVSHLLAIYISIDSLYVRIMTRLCIEEEKITPSTFFFNNN
jgi:hypothetical protein